MLAYNVHHTLNIGQHVIVPESQHRESLGLYKFVTDDISWILSVLASIYFYVQAGIQRHKIQNIRANRELTAEFDSCLLLSKVLP